MLILGHGAISNADAKGKPLKSAQIEVAFDAENAWDLTLDPTLITPNGIVTDDGSAVTDGVDGTDAIVGSSFDIIVDLQNSSRGFDIVIPARFEFSTYVETNSIQCGDIANLDDSYFIGLSSGGPSFSNAKFRVMGHDYLKLDVGSKSLVNADLEFHDANGNRWQLRWGPYEHRGTGITLNPGSDPVAALRVDADTWTFTTTGNHHAALYRYADPSTQVYYGQFAVPVSGTAMALSPQTVPDSTIPAINVKLTPPEIAIVEPTGDQTLPDGSGLVNFTVIAFDHCLDISEDTTWTVGGEPIGDDTFASWFTTFPDDSMNVVTATAVNRSGASASDTVIITIGAPDVDNDGDGWTVAEGDCDDNDPKVYPGANDTKGKQGRDGVDNDCNCVIDG